MADNTIVYNHDGLELPVSDWMHGSHSFLELTHVIQSTHDAAQTCAVKAINRMQTMRNWLIGYYIVSLNNMVRIGRNMEITFSRDLWRK